MFRTNNLGFFFSLKANILVNFKLFYFIVKYQSGCKLIQLCFNRGKEFISYEFIKYLNKHGIIEDLSIFIILRIFLLENAPSSRK